MHPRFTLLTHSLGRWSPPLTNTSHSSYPDDPMQVSTVFALPWFKPAIAYSTFRAHSETCACKFGKFSEDG